MSGRVVAIGLILLTVGIFAAARTETGRTLLILLITGGNDS
jgi:hypothetical protein